MTRVIDETDDSLERELFARRARALETVPRLDAREAIARAQATHGEDRGAMLVRAAVAVAAAACLFLRIGGAVTGDSSSVGTASPSASPPSVPHGEMAPEPEATDPLVCANASTCAVAEPGACLLPASAAACEPDVTCTRVGP